MRFVQWYNHGHRHSGIRYVTPAQRHTGQDGPVLAARHAVYQDARQRNPQRWSGPTRNWTPVGVVTLNPERDSIVRATTSQILLSGSIACFPVPTWQRRPSHGAQRRGMGGAEPPGATRSAPRRARAWRGWRAPDLPRSEHRATLITSRRFASPDIYAASAAASSIGGNHYVI